MSSSLEKARTRFAQGIRKRRAALKRTQEEIAEAAGLSPRHYQKLEAAELNMTLATMCRVADALCLALRDLL
jgi:transcriptional regulator with XRE-family HTH domain